jgi:hypothetical protein
MASNLPSINKPSLVNSDPAVKKIGKGTESSGAILSKPPTVSGSPDVIINISSHQNVGKKGPKPIDPRSDPGIKVPTPPPTLVGGPINYPKAIDPKSDPAIGKLKPKLPEKSEPFNPYKDKNTVQGWHEAYKTYGIGPAKTSPYQAALNGAVVSDANGNFMQTKFLGNTYTKGYITYNLTSQVNVNNMTVYTYVNSRDERFWQS